MNAESIARALNGRKTGSTWMVCCPAHEDRNPSLAIREDGGKVLLHCHAGCRQGDVVQALKSLGLWQPESDNHRWARRVVAAYDYTDASGSLLYQIVRYDPKDFRQRYPDHNGGWIWRKYEDQVLYRLPEVLEAPVVFVVEGERDVETLRAHGFVATTNAGGAKAPWIPQFTDALRGREVVLVPDNDVPGRARVITIARALLGHVARIIVWDPEDGKDITEWFERGHSETELIAQVEGDGVAR